MHRSAHNYMISVPDYVVPNPATRVRKLLYNIRSNNPTLLTSIESVQTSATLINDFEQTVDTLQLPIIPTKITTSQKQRISNLTGGRGARGGRRGGGCFGGIIANWRVSTVCSKSFLRVVEVWTFAVDSRRAGFLLLILDGNLRTLVAGLGTKNQGPRACHYGRIYVFRQSGRK